MLRQQKFLSEFLENLKTDPDKILLIIEKLRQKITQPSNMALYLAANLNHLKENPADALQSFITTEHKPMQKR